MRFIKALCVLALVGIAVNDARAATLYGIAPFGGTPNLYTINTSTGAATLVGSTGVSSPFDGIAFDATGTLYGYTPGGGPGDLYTINPATGAATLVGSTGLFAPQGGMSAQPGTDTLFAIDSSSTDHLLTINKSTGAATIVGAMGAAGRDVSGIAFQPNGALLGVALNDNSADMLVSINTSTGLASNIGPTGLNITNGLASLAFDPDSGTNFFTDSSSLYTVNTVSGVVTLVGGHGVSGFSGLAFDKVPLGPAAVPLPASAWMGLGLLAALGLRRAMARV